MLVGSHNVKVFLALFLLRFWHFSLVNSSEEAEWPDEVLKKIRDGYLLEYAPLLKRKESGDDNRVTTTNSATKNIVIYSCGMFLADTIKALFPKDEQSVLTYHALKTLKPDDVIVTGVHGRCPRGQLIESGIKVLFMNEEGEVDMGESVDNFYKIGPYPSHVATDNTMKVFQVAREMLSEPDVSMLIRSLSDVDFKPVNTGENFLLYVHKHCVPHREEAIAALSEIGVIHTGATCNASGYEVANRDNIQKTILPKGGHAYHNLRNHIKHYRFYFAMENTMREGYVTEKIMNAFLGGAIPIYYGTRDIFYVFNKDAFIYYNIENPQVALDRIAYLEGNRTAYYEMLRQPILVNGNETVREYFSLRDDIGGGQLKGRIRHMIGLKP